jgi:hypothetical protein
MVDEEPPRCDLYRVPGTGDSRDGVKQVLNALLAADHELTRFPKGTKDLFPSGRKFADIRESIYQFHAPIVPLFGTALGLQQQRMDSGVIVSVLLRLKAMGIVALPIHDCLLVPVHKAAITQSIMETTFKEISGVEATAVITQWNL